jgi:hypothetical protein
MNDSLANPALIKSRAASFEIAIARRSSVPSLEKSSGIERTFIAAIKSSNPFGVGGGGLIAGAYGQNTTTPRSVIAITPSATLTRTEFMFRLCQRYEIAGQSKVFPLPSTVALANQTLDFCRGGMWGSRCSVTRR